MGQIFTAFGIDWRLLVINLINFGLLLLALWYFLYGPITKLLEERRQKVAEGVAKAEESVKRLSEIEESRSAILAEAGEEADTLLAKAREAGALKERELRAQGEEAAAGILREAELQAKELKSQTLQEGKQELAKLVVLGMERIFAEGKK